MAQPARNPKTEQVQTLLTPEDLTSLDSWADDQRVSRSEAVRWIVTERLRSDGYPPRRVEMPGQMTLDGVS
jgi:hypothetical protein